jgi:putative membrane protein
VNRYIASCLLGKNKAEVEISKLAQQQAENTEVKKFAQMLVKDHSSMISKLQPLAGGQDASRPRQPSAATGTPSDRTGVASSTARPGQGDQAVNQLIAIEKKIIERCTELLRQELESKTGADFDKCYVGSQVGSHMQASAALEVISQQATGELQELAGQAKEKVDHHLQEAKQLAQQLEGSAVRDPSVRQTSAERRQ